MRPLTPAQQQRRRLIRMAIGVCAVSVVIFVTFLFQTNSTHQQVQASDDLDEAYSIVELHSVINRERLKRGIDPLVLSPKLNTAAQAKADDMQTKRYFSHVSPIDGKEWKEFIVESGYEYKEAGENLANGYDVLEEMITAWLNSPSHRANMLNTAVSETGFGVRTGELDGFPTIFVVQVFGERAEPRVNAIQIVGIINQDPRKL